MSYIAGQVAPYVAALIERDKEIERLRGDLAEARIALANLEMRLRHRDENEFFSGEEHTISQAAWRDSDAYNGR